MNISHYNIYVDIGNSQEYLLLHGYRFSAITNGTNLQDYAELLQPEIFSKIQVTIHGSESYYNTDRKSGDTFIAFNTKNRNTL